MYEKKEKGDFLIMERLFLLQKRRVFMTNYEVHSLECDEMYSLECDKVYSLECDELYSEEYIQDYIEKLHGINYDFVDEYHVVSFNQTVDIDGDFF